MLTYKFLPPDRVSFLEDGLLRFTQPADLNDPFECTAVVTDKDALEVMAQIKKNQKAEFLGPRATTQQKIDFRRHWRNMRQNQEAHIRFAREQFERILERDINARFGVLSLSKRWNSSLMWSHYGRYHTGFCVGFDARHDFFLGKSHPGVLALENVRYSKDRILVPSEIGKGLDIFVLYTKSEEWKYEKEQRAVGWLDRANFKKAKSPYSINLFEVPRQAIREIVVGARAEISLIASIREFCSKFRVSLFKSVLSSTTFDMERVQF